MTTTDQYQTPEPYPHASPSPYPGPPVEIPREIVGEGAPVYGRPIPEGRHTAPVCSEPPSEMLMSLNGFDEIAIAIRFGQSLGEMREADAITTGRALAFVYFRRQGQRDDEAHTASMNLTMRQVVEFFAPEPPKPDAASAEGNA